MSLRLGLANCVFRSVEMLSVARHCGFDLLMVDMEHSALTLGDVATLCVAGREAGYPVHVRVPGARSEYLARVADCGAAGIIVPHVDTVDEARHIVAALRFAPQGKRSIPSPIALTGFRPVPARELVALSEHALEITVMIESTEAMACLDDIASVDGIDGLMVGTNDLVASMGLIGQPEHADVCTAFATIAATARDHGRNFSVIGLPTQLLQSHALSLGAGLVVLTNDINLLFEAGEARVRDVRALSDLRSR